MKQKIRKILCLMLVVVLCIASVPLSGITESGLFEIFGFIAQAESSGSCGTNLTWSLSDGVLTISGTGKMYNYQSAASSPWYNSSSVKKVVLEDGVTTIGNYAFASCSKLSEIEFAESVTSIGSYAFIWCTGLTDIVIPDNITKVGSTAFQSCKNLENVFIGSGLETLGSYSDGMFLYCNKLKAFEVDAGNSYFSSEDGVLFNNDRTQIVYYPVASERTTYSIPGGVTHISHYAFAYCDKLTEIVIPAGVTVIDKNAFYACDGITEITIPSGVKTIGEWAFCGCDKLSSVVIPKSVVSIDGMAFGQCEKLKSVTILNPDCSIFSGSTNVYDGASTIASKATIYGYANSTAQAYANKYGRKFVATENLGEIFADEYDFNRDRYSFRNIVDNVSVDIYQDVYGDEKGEVIYNKYEKGNASHGLCYGMAVTTASLLLDIPQVYSFIRYAGPCKYISDINRGTKCFELDAITAKTFVKYGYATQYSTQAQFQEYMEDCEDIYNAVYDYVYNDGTPVTIGLREFTYDKTKDEWSQSFGHEVLAVGLTGDNGIIVDDSNSNSKRTIYLIRDSNGIFTNEWTYTEYSETTNGTNSFDTSVGVARVIGYNTAIALPYLVLGGNAQLDTYPDVAEEDENDETTCKVNVIDNDYNLVAVTSNEYSIASDDGYLLPIGKPVMGANTEDNECDLYWINENSNISVSNFVSEMNEVIIANNETALKAVVCNGSTVKMAASEKVNNLEAEITAIKGNEYSITIDTTNVDGKDMDIITTGIASDDKIIAIETEAGLTVTGISDGAVTLTVNDEVISTKTIDNAVGDIEITYDKNGIDNEVELDYHSHSYTSEVITPSTHLTEGIMTYTCACSDTYTETIAKLPGHTYNTVVTAPTCTEQGYTTYTCECGDSYVDNITDVVDHKDNDGDEFCDYCDEFLGSDEEENKCSHICHKSGFMGFIWKIVKFFWKLFGMNPVCECGAAHY